ncbi:uncharacterized protein BHQ10_002348 [Talaromyces amestolkiae]|uniref:N-acetyltransferase domain-containing protein n=1 Tax=Talaromyces amestolkiae TaxID=1196081 RepID=A0A364KS07_TALAM|nr:uncharacterized protein BHQ10_002348 [Talaromyces amestolkiae]RAO66336.1 hypothetical protein BHQ10_002348 [Talaromyces amestolkiae]
MASVLTTTGGDEYVGRVAEVIAAAFSNSIFTAYLHRTSESTWPSTQVPIEILRPYFEKSIAHRVLHGAELVEAGNWAAVAVWVPPGISIPASGALDPRIHEYRDRFAEVKKEYMQDRQYWYLNLIGRHPDRTEPGVVRALIDPYLHRARAAGIPVWLEAISEHGRQVYEHLSFRTVAEVRLGVGKVNGNGELDKKGEGLVVFGMMAE